MVQAAEPVEEMQHEGANGVAGQEARFRVDDGLAGESLRLIDAPTLAS